jgi:hypothetical protein
MVNAEGEVMRRNTSFDRLQNIIDRDMLDAWVLSESEFDAVYNTDKFLGYDEPSEAAVYYQHGGII